MPLLEINAEMLRAWPLPPYSTDGDKEDRGHVLVIAGSAEIPGAAILASVAALRAGAGKLAIATEGAIAALVAQSVPEARVIALPADDSAQLPDLPDSLDALLIGPGMQSATAAWLVPALLKKYPSTKTVLDAAAIKAITTCQPHDEVLITPHAGELASLMQCDKQAIRQDPETFALQAVRHWRVTVALKGAETYLAMPDDRVWIHRGGDIGLATSGSGDVLAGLIAGLLAQGVSLAQAAAWGIAVHAWCGQAAGDEQGCTTGYLARDISGHAPGVINRLRTAS